MFLCLSWSVCADLGNFHGGLRSKLFELIHYQTRKEYPMKTFSLRNLLSLGSLLGASLALLPAIESPAAAPAVTVSAMTSRPKTHATRSPRVHPLKPVGSVGSAATSIKRSRAGASSRTRSSGSMVTGLAGLYRASMTLIPSSTPGLTRYDVCGPTSMIITTATSSAPKSLEATNRNDAVHAMRGPLIGSQRSRAWFHVVAFDWSVAVSQRRRLS